MENGLRSGLAAVALTTILSITMAGAADFRTLYSFCAKEHCVDGNGVYTNRLLLDSSGTILSTTGYGGRGEWGTIFQLVPNEDRSKYRHSVLYSFCKKRTVPMDSFPTLA